jgi:hypothetical protein
MSLRHNLKNLFTKKRKTYQSTWSNSDPVKPNNIASLNNYEKFISSSQNHQSSTILKQITIYLTINKFYLYLI